MLAHIGRINRHRRTTAIRCIEGDVVEHPFHHRLQTAGADILHGGIELYRDIRQGIDAAMPWYVHRLTGEQTSDARLAARLLFRRVDGLR